MKPGAGIHLGFGRKRSKKFIEIKFILSFSEELSNGRELPNLWAWEAERGTQQCKQAFCRKHLSRLNILTGQSRAFVSQAAHRLDCTSS